MSLIKKFFNTYSNLPKVVYTLSICMLINGMGNFVLPIITLILTQKIGLTPKQVGVYLGAYMVVQSICLIANGKLLDYIGRKKVLVLFYILSALSYFICFVIPISIVTTFFIFIAAILFAMITPTFNVLIADVTDINNRKQSFSLTYLVFNIGNAISPIIGGLLFENHLKILFIANSISIIICIFIIISFLPHTYGTYENEKNIRLEKKSDKEQMSILILMKQTTLILIACTMFVYQLAYSQWGFLLPLQMVEAFGTKGSTYYGLIAGINGAIVIICTPIITHKMKGLNGMKSFLLGGICYGVSCCLFGISNHIIGFIGAMIILTIGEIIIILNYNPLLVEYIPVSHRGRILSILPILTGTGYVLGPIISGQLIGFGYMNIWIIIGLLVLIIASFNYRLLTIKR